MTQETLLLTIFHILKYHLGSNLHTAYVCLETIALESRSISTYIFILFILFMEKDGLRLHIINTELEVERIFCLVSYIATQKHISED